MSFRQYPPIQHISSSKTCLSIQKLTYFIRTTPLWLFPSLLEEFDLLLKDSLESILNIHLEANSWILATLPVSFGGLGVRRVIDICLPAFLASTHGVLDFIKSILFYHGDGIRISHLDDALNKWSILSNNSNFLASPSVQKQWNRIQASNIYQTVLSSSTCEADEARFHAIKQKESGTWLQTIPSPNIGTLIDSKSFRIAVGLRLGIKICFPT